MKNKGLGRGLDALLSNDIEQNRLGLEMLAIDQLTSGKYQPRTSMDQEQLNDLANSIKSQGMMQPILVRKKTDQLFEIIAGERRWRASKIAGLTEVPVIIKDISDSSALAMALIENMQREDLNVIEEANGIKRLIEEFDMTHESAADALGKSRVAVSNLLRLLNLTERVQAALLEKKIEMGHARALISLEASDQVMLCQKIISQKLSVREVENLVSATKLDAKGRFRSKSEDIRIIENEISESIGLKVSIHHNQKGNGYLKISYSNLDEIQQILDKLK